MTAEEFSAAVDEAKRLEKKIMEYAPYEGDMDMESSMVLEPKEYLDLNYNNLLIQYERSQKIIKAAGLDIYAEKEGKREEAPPSAESEEVETKLREMTTETLKEAEEVSKGPIIEKEEVKPPVEEAPAPERYEQEIEIEKPTVPEEKKEMEKPEEEIIFEKPPEAGPEEIELEKPEEKPPELPKEEEVKPPVEEKVAPPVPPALRETPDEAASKKYQQMEDQIRSMLGEKADELTLKKKMLELTKQLFKEKVTSKREEIKLQITVIKNILVSMKEGVKVKKKKGKKDETHAQLYDTLLSTQQAEIARTKDEVIGKYKERVNEIKKKFYEDVSGAEDAAKKKKIYEGFVFSVTSLVEQVPESVKEYTEFLKKKHAAEMERLRDSIEEKDKVTKAKVEERLDHINTDYGSEFLAVRGIIGRDIDNLIEVTAEGVFKPPKEAKPEDEEAKAVEIVKEVEETDEGTLLYFLHSKDPDYYKQYERKKLAKAEAIFKAKALMAKEKGLSDSMVKKYFSSMEG